MGLLIGQDFPGVEAAVQSALEDITAPLQTWSARVATDLVLPTGAIVGTTDTQTLSAKTISGTLGFAGATSGTTTLAATAVAGTTALTLPAATDTLVGRATTDTLTNKTLTSPALTTPSMTSPAVTSGVVDLQSGQIAFPAAQSASAGANTLDDYEEGTWTPVIGGSGGTSGQTYATQVGSYVKIGKLVIAQFNVVLSAKGTITTNVQIQGLPFTIENTTSANPPLVIGQWGGLATTWVFIGGFGAVNTTAAGVNGLTAAGTGATSLVTGDIGNSTQFVGTIMYRATA